VERPLFQNLAASNAIPDHGFVVGAVYNRRTDIHGRFGGQVQYGISTPRDHPYVFLFTAVGGLRHGYFDQYADDGTFHYYGEGQVGDMRMDRGNKEIRDHQKNGKKLLVFLGLGGGLYRFLGEFVYASCYIDPENVDRQGQVRNAIVFRLQPVQDEFSEEDLIPVLPPDDLVGGTQREAIVTIRTKQALFRRRVATLERACRLTGVMDLRFLRASHIKPWAESTDKERINAHNGLLLTPSADLLFDHGWISFRDDGKLIVADKLPTEVQEKLGLDLRRGKDCGTFTEQQASFLEHHRDCILGHRERQDLLAARLLG